MMVRVSNAQREMPVDVSTVTRVARCAVRRLSIHEAGMLSIAFVTQREIRTLNRRFLRHDRLTDVLSFRYDGPSTRPARGGARSGFPPPGVPPGLP